MSWRLPGPWSFIELLFFIPEGAFLKAITDLFNSWKPNPRLLITITVLSSRILALMQRLVSDSTRVMSGGVVVASGSFDASVWPAMSTSRLIDGTYRIALTTTSSPPFSLASRESVRVAHNSSLKRFRSEQD